MSCLVQKRPLRSYMAMIRAAAVALVNVLQLLELRGGALVA